MATLKQRLHRKNSSGSYDVVHLETSASCVLMTNGNTAEAEIMSKLPMKGTFSSDIDATDIDPGVWNLNGYDKTKTSLDVFPYGDDSVYGTFIQYPGSYKTQVILAGSSGYAVAGFVRRYYTSSKTWCPWKSTTELPDHTHDAGDITSGTLGSARLPTIPMTKGGMGQDISGYPPYALLRMTSDPTNTSYDYVYRIATASGALYATKENGEPNFGTLPVAQGGTGKTTLTSGSYLVGAGTSAVALKTPAQVLSDIGAMANVAVTTSDNGKFLRVVSGAWAAATVPSAEEASF